MKKLLFALLLTVATFGICSAATTVTVYMPGNTFTFTRSEDVVMPNNTVVQYQPINSATYTPMTSGWNIPVHWESGSKKDHTFQEGNFQLSGSGGVTLNDVINFLIAFYF